MSNVDGMVATRGDRNFQRTCQWFEGWDDTQATNSVRLEKCISEVKIREALTVDNEKDGGILVLRSRTRVGGRIRFRF